MNKSWLMLLCTTVLLLSVVSAQSADAASDDNPFQSDLERRISEAAEGSTIILRESGTLTSDLVIPRNITLLLPCDGNDTVGTRDGDEGCLKMANIQGAHINKNDTVTEDIYITLTVDYGVTVTVYGTIVVGGVISYPTQSSYQGHTSGIHSNITLNGTIALKDGADLKCYGFIRGDGGITASAGASIYEPLVIFDSLRAGDTVNLYSSGQMPFNRYALMNIQTETVYYSGSQLFGMTTIFFSDSMNHYDMTIIGDNGGLISLADGASAILTYDADRFVFNAVDEGLVWNLGDDAGRTTVSIHGGATIKAPILSVNVRGFSLVIDFSKVEFSIPYTFQFELCEGEYTLDSSIRILPGADVIVDETSILTVNGGITAYWGLRDVLFRYESYPWDSMLIRNGFETCGHFVVNGYLVLEDGSSFCGIIEHTSPAGGVVVKEGADVDDRKVSYGCIRTEYKYLTMQTTENLSTRTMAGYVFIGDSLTRMEAGNDYAASELVAHKINAFPQRNEVEKKTTEYKTDQDFEGTWYIHPVDVPEKVVVEDVPFEVEVAGTTVSATDITSALAEIAVTEFPATQAPVINLESATPSTTMTLASDTVEAVKYAGVAVTVNLAPGSVRIAANTLNEFSGDAVVTLIASKDPMTPQQRGTIGDRTAILLSLDIGGIGIESTSCFATISLPYTPTGDVDKIQVWNVDENGEAHSYKATYADGMVTFQTRTFGSAYAIAYSEPPVPEPVPDNTIFYIAAAILVVVVIAAGVVFFRVIWQRM